MKASLASIIPYKLRDHSVACVCVVDHIFQHLKVIKKEICKAFYINILLISSEVFRMRAFTSSESMKVRFF